MPIENKEALAARDAKRAMPTAKTSADLQRLSREVCDAAHFSARTTHEGLLQRQMRIIRELLSPSTRAAAPDAVSDPAYARDALKRMLRAIGYQPGTTGPVGTLADLASDARIDLIVRTNVEMAYGAGKLARDQAPDRLEAFPAQELYRLEGRAKTRPWEARWKTAGSASGRRLGDGWGFYAGRMIALKNHPIWSRLGDPGLFADGLGNQFPPFAFNSGMWVEDVSLAEAMSLGVLAASDALPAPVSVSFHLGGG